MSVRPAAIFADQGAVRFAAISPAPTDGRQVKAADRLVADGAIVAVGQTIASIQPFGGRVFITQYAEFNGHSLPVACESWCASEEAACYGP